MKTITLTNSELVVEVDDEDVVYLILLGPYCLSDNGYPRTTKQPYAMLHSLVAKRMGLVAETTDHEDRNKLNAKRSNLKAASYEENNANQSVRTTNTTGHKFIAWYEKRQRFVVRIERKGHRKHLGYHKTLAEAIRVRDHYLNLTGLKAGDL